jgi:hypothetical protein
MNKAVFFVVVFMLIAATGCNTAARIPIPIETPTTTYDAESVAITMDEDGVKYLAWEECNLITCRIVYTRYLLDQVGDFYYFEPASGYHYTDPDIEVIDDGDVYLTWRVVNVGSFPLEPEGCFNIMPDGVPSDSDCHDLYTPINFTLGDAPLLATNGTEVYAVYRVDYDPSGSDIRYRQLSSTDPAARGFVSHYDDVDQENYDPSIWVSDAGWLYVAWIHTDTSLDRILAINNNYGDTDGGIFEHLLTNSAYEGVESCATTVEEVDDFAYYVIGQENAGSDMIVTFYRNADNTGSLPVGLEADMPPTAHWEVRDHLSLVPIGDSVYAGFSGYNDASGASGEYEVYGFAYQQGDTSIGLVTVTDNDDVDLAPILRPVSCPECGSYPPFEMGWRGSDSGLDFYHVFSTPMAEIEQIFTSPGGSPGFPDFDMASGGQWVAAIWIDYLSDSDTRQVPWISFNVYSNKLPLIVE